MTDQELSDKVSALRKKSFALYEERKARGEVIFDGDPYAEEASKLLADMALQRAELIKAGKLPAQDPHIEE